MTANVQVSDRPEGRGWRPSLASPERGRKEPGSPFQGTVRTAGLSYLVMGVGTAFGMGYVDPLLRATVQGGAAAVAIRSSEPLFLAGCASTALGLVAMLFLASALFELFERVDRAQARLLVVFVAIGVGIALLNMCNALLAIRLSHEDGLPAGVDSLQRQALIATLLGAYRYGGAVATLFWGLWMLPFGRLLLRSGIAPRALGVLMAVGGVPYLAHGAGLLFFPAWAEVTQRSLAIPSVAERWAIGWLLARGWRTVEPRPAERGEG